jgi:hypothetical protein
MCRWFPFGYAGGDEELELVAKPFEVPGGGAAAGGFDALETTQSLMCKEGRR